MIYEEEQMRQRVTSLIHREGLTQREFANKIGRLPTNVSQILTGERHIPLCLQTMRKRFWRNMATDCQNCQTRSIIYALN